MAWLHKFFKRDPRQEQPPASPSEAAPATTPPKPTSTTVLQVVAEETIMSVAQWLVNLVNQSIQTNNTQPKPEAAVPIETPPITEVHATIPPSPLMEELMAKFTKLIEQMYERDQQLIPLENRLKQVESAFVQTNEKKIELEQKLQKSLQLIDVLNQRLMKLEAQSEDAKNQAITNLAKTTEPLDKRLQQVEATLAQHHQLNHQLKHQRQESLQLLDRLHHRLDQVETQVEQAKIPAADCTQQVKATFAQHHYLKHQLQESLQLIDRINERLDQMEVQTLPADPPADPEPIDLSPGAIALFDDRIFQLTAEIEQDDSSQEKIEQLHHNITQLEERIENIEKLLAMFSIVPQLISENRQGIAALQTQLTLNGHGTSAG